MSDEQNQIAGLTQMMEKLHTIANILVEAKKQADRESNDVQAFIDALERTERRLQEEQGRHDNP